MPLFPNPDRPGQLRVLQRLVALATFVITAVVLTLAFLLLWPQHPFEVKNVGQPYVEGGVVHYDLSYCKNSTAVSTVYRQLVGAGSNLNGYGFPAIEGVALPGCHTSHVLVPLPTGVQPGPYFIHADLAYPVNSLRIVHVYYNTKPFNVTQQGEK